MTKHTPGPWHIGVCTAYNKWDVYGELGELVAVADAVFTNLATAQANASLIVAAPETAAERDRLKASNAELLEALRDVLHHQVYGTSTSLPLAIERAQAAIDKAEGRTC